MEAIRHRQLVSRFGGKSSVGQKGAPDSHCTQLKRKQCEAVLHFCQDGICRHKQNLIYTLTLSSSYTSLCQRESVTEKGMKIAVGFLAETMRDKRKWNDTFKFDA